MGARMERAPQRMIDTQPGRIQRVVAAELLPIRIPCLVPVNLLSLKGPLAHSA